MDFWEEKIPTGYKFNPTKHQLIEYYLTPKVLGQNMDFCSWFVFEKDLYDGYSNPLVLFDEINQNYDTKYFCDDREKGHQIRYFFTPLNKVSKTGKNIKRTTKDGTWDGDRNEKIELPGTGTLIGLKKTLNFRWNKGVESEYARRGKQSSWIMHQFSLPQTFYDFCGMKENYVLCSIRRKGGAHADHHVIPQQQPLMDAEVPLKRQRMIHEKPVEEPVAAIKDTSSSARQDDLISTNDLLLRNDEQQEEENYFDYEFVKSLEADLIKSNDEAMMISELGKDNSSAEAMNTCVPVPTLTTMLSPSLDAVPAQQPFYVNGPYMSSSTLFSCAPPPAKPAIVSPAKITPQTSYINMQSSTSPPLMVMETQAMCGAPSAFMADMGSLLEAPSAKIVSSTKATPLNNNLSGNNSCDVIAGFNRTSIIEDNIGDILIGLVEDGDTYEFYWN